MKSLDERIAEERAKLAEIRASVTDADRERAKKRQELAAAKRERDEEERDKLARDLDDRVDLAKDALGHDAVEGLMVLYHKDTFVVVADSKAHAKWETEIAKSAQASAQGRKGPDRATVHRDYARSCVYDWNG